MKHIYLILFSIFALSSCKSDKYTVSETYFGGEIINPNDDFVILFKDDEVIDSIRLDENNRFSTKIKHCKPGLYHFYHKPEYQYIFIEPQDSLLLRLNTLDFDESLVFSGEGSEKNNFLIETFLSHEENEKVLFKAYKNNLYTLQPEEFKSQIDSLRNIKIDELEKKKGKYGFSKDFIEVGQASIDLGLYDKIETYPIKNAYKEIPESFYNYRSQLKLDNEVLFTYHPYHNYLYTYANNLALESCSKSCEDKNVDMRSPHYNHHKLMVLDSVIEHETLKNYLTKRAALEFLENTTCKDQAKKYFNAFSEINTNKDFVNKVKEITKSIQNLEVGNTIPDIPIYANDVNSSLTKIIDSPTVFYFWTASSPRHLKVVHEKVADLEAKKLNVEFVGLNLDSDSQAWNTVIKSYKFNNRKEYQLQNLDKAKQELMLSSVHKIIIVDDEGKILSTKANIFDTKFEDHLAGLFNEK